MRFFRRPVFFYFILSLGLPACRVQPGDEPDVVVTLPPEFIVDLYEQRDPLDGHATFGLWVETVKTDYPAANYRIETSVETAADGFTVRLLEVAAPDQPEGGPGPARAFVPVGLPADGAHRFTILLGNTLVNEGALTVAPGRYELALPQPEAGIDLQNRVLFSIPPGTVWGFALTPTEIQTPVANEFLLKIKDFTSEAGLAPGFYGYFTVAGTGQAFFHRSVLPGTPAQFFVRRLTASPDALRGLLQNYRSSQQTPLEIRCWTTEGEL